MVIISLPLKTKFFFKLCLVCLLVWSFQPIEAMQSSEKGLPFSQIFLPDDFNGDSRITSITQDSRGIIFAANNTNILEYDGERWRHHMHPDNQNPVAVAVGEDGKLYAAFLNDLGYFTPDPTGLLQFSSLLSLIPDSIRDIGDFEDVQVTGDGIFFKSTRKLLIWHPNKEGEEAGSLRIVGLPHGEMNYFPSYCNGRYLLFQDPYLLYELQNEQFQLIMDDTPPTTYFTHFNGDTLMGVGWGVFLFANGEYIQFSSDIYDFCKKNLAKFCIPLPDSTFLLTSRKGVAIFNRKGEILQIFDKSNILPNNSVVSPPFIDNQGGIWFGLEFGIVRAELLSNLSFFDESQGISGEIYNIARFKNSLFLGTRLGLQKLIPSTNPRETASITKFWSGFTFCSDLLPLRESLIYDRNKGISELIVEDKEPKRIVYRPQIDRFVMAPDSARVFISTRAESGTMDGVSSIQKRNGVWVDEGKIPGTSASARFMCIDNRSGLWYLGDHGRIACVRFEKIQDGSRGESHITLYDSSKGITTKAILNIFCNNNNVFLSTSIGYFKYNESLDSFELDEDISRKLNPFNNEISNLVEDKQGRLWYDIYGKKEICATRTEDGNFNLTYPLLRANIRDYNVIYPDEDGDVVWAAGDGGKLIRYEERTFETKTISPEILIRRVLLNSDSSIYNGSPSDLWITPEIPYVKQNLRFEYALLSFDCPQANRYQYRLIHSTNWDIKDDEDWSVWSSESYRDFNNLWEGEYSFQVRGLDVYDRISGIATFEFRILPPYFRTWWSYSLYGLILLGLLYIFTQIRVKRLNQAKEKLEKLVEERSAELASTKFELEWEKQAEETARLASIGVMAGGITHEINQPLNAISLNAGTLKYLEESGTDIEPDKKRRLIDDINWGTSRISEIIEHMRSFWIARETTELETVDLVVCARNALQLFARQLEGHSIELQTQFDKTPVKVKGISLHIEQIVLNLVSNSIRALDRSEKNNKWVKVDVKHVSPSEQYSESMALLEVNDNGPGLPEEIGDELYNPMFSTGKNREGTGLGLAIVKNFVAQCNGDIFADNNKDNGARFRIYLPLVDEKNSK